METKNKRNKKVNLFQIEMYKAMWDSTVILYVIATIFLVLEILSKDPHDFYLEHGMSKWIYAIRIFISHILGIPVCKFICLLLSKNHSSYIRWLLRVTEKNVPQTEYKEEVLEEARKTRRLAIVSIINTILISIIYPT